MIKSQENSIITKNAPIPTSDKTEETSFFCKKNKISSYFHTWLDLLANNCTERENYHHEILAKEISLKARVRKRVNFGDTCSWVIVLWVQLVVCMCVCVCQNWGEFRKWWRLTQIDELPSNSVLFLFSQFVSKHFLPPEKMTRACVLSRRKNRSALYHN